jgi:hypothetical protein
MGYDWIKEQDVWGWIDKILNKSGKGGLMAFGGAASYDEWDASEADNVWYSSEIATFRAPNKEERIKDTKPVMRRPESFSKGDDEYDQSKPSNEAIIAMLFK